MKYYFLRLILCLTISILTCNVDAQPYTTPAEIPRFQPVLSGCKLQAPTSSTAATAEELMNGYTSGRFFVAEDDKIGFNQSGQSMRTELRHETNWIISDGDRSIHGRLKFVLQTCDQVTVVQIHDDANAGSGPNKPLLRIYKHLTKSPENHLWAAIKTDNEGINTRHIDLGLAPAGYFNWDVIIKNGFLIINIKGIEKVNEEVSFWTFPSYWKAGVYLQDEGEATVYFDELYLGDQEVVLSVEDEVSSGINIYPNPTSSFVTIEFENENFMGGTVSLYGVSGKLLKETLIDCQKMMLPMIVKEGLYFVKVQKGDLSMIFKVIGNVD